MNSGQILGSEFFGTGGVCASLSISRNEISLLGNSESEKRLFEYDAGTAAADEGFFLALNFHAGKVDFAANFAMVKLKVSLELLFTRWSYSLHSFIANEQFSELLFVSAFFIEFF